VCNLAHSVIHYHAPSISCRIKERPGGGGASKSAALREESERVRTVGCCAPPALSSSGTQFIELKHNAFQENEYLVVLNTSLGGTTDKTRPD